MTLNGVTALIFRNYFTEFIALEADDVTVVEDKPMSAKYRLPVIFGQNCPAQHRTVSATAKLPCFIMRKQEKTGAECNLHPPPQFYRRSKRPSRCP